MIEWFRQLLGIQLEEGMTNFSRSLANGQSLVQSVSLVFPKFTFERGSPFFKSTIGDIIFFSNSLNQERLLLELIPN